MTFSVKPATFTSYNGGFLSKTRSAVLGAILLLTASPAVMASTVSTRFGTLSTDDMNTLLFKERPLDPSIQGNSSLHITQTFQIGSTDQVVVQDIGGTDCPAMYYVVTVTEASAVATREFGTCSDLATIKRTPRGISLTMPAFAAYGEKMAKSTANKNHVFEVINGSVTDNGRPLRGSK